jgi:hypothetical protein
MDARYSIVLTQHLRVCEVSAVLERVEPIWEFPNIPHSTGEHTTPDPILIQFSCLSSPGNLGADSRALAGVAENVNVERHLALLTQIAHWCTRTLMGNTAEVCFNWGGSTEKAIRSSCQWD